MRKKILMLVVCFIYLQISFSQNNKQPVPVTDTTRKIPAKPPENKTGPKPYKEIITDKAKTNVGFFTVHQVEDKYYFEIPDSLIGREWMAEIRIAKTTNGVGYGGEERNNQTLRWEKGVRFC